MIRFAKLDFEETLAKQREKLLAGEDRLVRKLVRSYSEVDQAIKHEFDAVTSKIGRARASGIEVSDHWLFQQERYRQMLAAVHDQVAKYSGMAESLAKDRMAETVQLGLFDSSQIARAAGIRGGFVRLQAKELEHIAGAFYDGSPLRKLFSGFGPKAARKASSAFVKGIGLGKNPKEIAKQLAGDIEGLSLDRAVRIARTESLRAYTTAQAENYLANSDVVVAMRIVSALDGRTCPMCWARHGQVIPLETPFYRHPGCRCTLVPVTGYEEDLGIDMRTGDEILRSRGRTYAESILGEKRAALWWDGEVGMRDFYKEVRDPDWGRRFSLRNLTDLAGVAAARAGESADVVFPLSTIGTGLPFKKHYLDVGSDQESAVERGLRAIEAVHDMGPLQGIDLAVMQFDDLPSAGGYMVTTQEGVLSHVGMTGSRAPLASTFMHEFGHVVDKATLSKGPSPMSMFPGPHLNKKQSKALERWSRALMDTDEVKRLVFALETGHFPVGDDGRYIPVDYGLHEHIKYLISPAEMWARSYAQFIAERSGDRIIKREIQAQLASDHPVDQVRQWRGFSKLGDAVAAVLRAWGYKLK